MALEEVMLGSFSVILGSFNSEDTRQLTHQATPYNISYHRRHPRQFQHAVAVYKRFFTEVVLRYFHMESLLQRFPSQKTS